MKLTAGRVGVHSLDLERERCLLTEVGDRDEERDLCTGLVLSERDEAGTVDASESELAERSTI